MSNTPNASLLANQLHISCPGPHRGISLRTVSLADAFLYVTKRAAKLSRMCLFGHLGCASYDGGPCAEEIRDALKVRGVL